MEWREWSRPALLLLGCGCGQAPDRQQMQLQHAVPNRW